MSRRILSALLFVLVGFASMATATVAQDDFNCDDFPNRDAAQAELDANPSDPNGLDGRPGADNGDGQACENFNYGSGESSSGGGNEGSDGGESSDDGGAGEDTSSGDSDSEPVAEDDDAVVDDETSELPDTGTGPVSAAPSTGLVAMLALGTLLCTAAATQVRSRVNF